MKKILGVAAVCLVVAGCGGGGSSEEAAIQTVMTTFAKNMEQGNFEAICDDLVTKETVDTLEGLCPKLFAEAADIGEGEFHRMNDISSIQVDGNTAEVLIIGGGKPMTLEKVASEWRIALDLKD